MSGRSVLVTVDEFHGTLALVRGLREGGFRPLVAVSRGDTYSARSRAAARVLHVPSEEDEPGRFAGRIAELARELDVAAVLPGTEPALVALSRSLSAFSVPVGVPGPDLVSLATDKHRILDLAEQCGLEGPPSFVGTPSELAERAGELPVPAILKPARSRVEMDERLAVFEARRFENHGELLAALRDLPEATWVVQPFIRGGLCAVSGVCWEGRVLCTVHQDSPRVWPIDVGFSSYAVTVPPDPDLDTRLGALLERTRWSGLFQLQMLRAPDGRRLLIDFNPRAYGSLALAIGAGANLPALWVRAMLGEVVPQPTYRIGVRYRLETAELKLMLGRARAGHPLHALEVARPRRRTVHAVFRLRDPAPALVALHRLRQKLSL